MDAVRQHQGQMGWTASGLPLGGEEVTSEGGRQGVSFKGLARWLLGGFVPEASLAAALGL
jgi:hypothetical protein